MNDALIAQIQRFTLEARHSLEQEASEQLEGLYGWMPDGSFAKVNLYPALSQIEEARETRRRLEEYATAEKEAGFSAAVARQKLIRETAFTWLNRFVALRMMEDQRLIKTAVSRLTESNAYLFWLADETEPDARKLHDLGETPVNPMGEGPRHVAYRRFLLWQCGELARDVSVLFDPNTLASRLFPRPNVLKSLIEAMNAEDLVEAWKPGNEETIGWIYEAFISEEKDLVFAGFQKGKKVTPEQIPSATQVFTPQWVVRFLVENSVGRLWVEMHPDSRLKDSLAYLVPIDKKGQRPLKPVREITLLDPATGSMHFGLVAFDLFREMYREELENAGKPGWPEKPSVETAEDIPASIILHNLHGIDIDLRAIQLSALTLFLRARSLNPKCSFTDKNLACANVEQITGGRLDEFIRQSRFSHPIYERILRGMAARLRDSNSLGSLLRPEVDLEQLIAEERAKAEKDKQLLLSFPGVTKEQFQTKEGMESFFAILSEEISRHLDDFVRNTQSEGNGARHFAAEAAKGLRFLRLVQQQYDVVATNPPYMSRRNQSALIAEFLDDYYSNSKADLYAAFIERSVELTADVGLTAMITQQSFMFISSYEKLRINLRKAIAIETMAHLGPKAFQMVTGEKVNTTTFVFRKEPDEKRREENEGIYFRLVHERDAEAKRTAFESALAALRAGQTHPLLFRYCQRDFDAIPGKPWAYWTTARIRTIFLENPKTSQIAKPWVGLQTSDNTRFLRFWWEVGRSNIAERCESADQVRKTGRRWVPHMKGGRFQRWYGNQEYVVNWYNDGKEMKAFAEEMKLKVKSPPGNGPLREFPYYFLPGVTWTHTSSLGLNSRFMPAGFICNVEGMACYPVGNENIKFVLAILNSAFGSFVVNQLNPTIHYGSAEVGNLPLPTLDLTKADTLITLSNEAVSLAIKNAQEDECCLDFSKPFHDAAKGHPSRRSGELQDLQKKIDDEVFRLYRFDLDDRAVVKAESSNISIEDAADGPQDQAEDTTDVANIFVDFGCRWISYAVGCILTRFAVAVPGGLGCGNFTPEVASALKTLAAPDGILTNDPGQPFDLSQRVWRAIEAMLSPEEARLRVSTVLGDGDPLELLLGWFDRFSGQLSVSFWKYHFQLYRKRPVYWPLQSPKRQYTVWVFHERFTRDTLFHIRNNIVETRLRLAEREIADLRVRAENDRRAQKELDRHFDFRDDLDDFSKRLKEITDRGYIPHIDDGVLLNAAPLHEILPSWPETKEAWEELEKGEYDWAHQAMEYWPERVKEKCKTNKSFAIAHCLEELFEEKALPPKRGRRRTK